MRDLLKSLAGCEDLASLKSTLAKLFTQFGEIAQMDVLTMTQPGKRQALCFLRLASAAQEQQAMANLGVTRFGNELLLVVDLPAAQAHAAEPLAHRTDNGRQSESASSLTATT
ncbi:MAG TPA: RNA-binding protein [Burkholderiales bacterium]|nr:RNA-binding protein [Burkholderiales bacterium]